jgi:hypothetical protein
MPAIVSGLGVGVGFDRGANTEPSDSARHCKTIGCRCVPLAAATARRTGPAARNGGGAEEKARNARGLETHGGLARAAARTAPKT